MGHSYGKSVANERRSQESISRVDKSDHLTKRGGGTPTHGEPARFKIPEHGPRDKDNHHNSAMDALQRAAKGGGAPKSGPGPSDVNGDW